MWRKVSSINFEFQRNIPFTEFIENDSWLQKRDPGAYLFGFIALIIGVLITHSWIVISAGIILCLVGIWLSKIQISQYINGLIKALPFILVIAAINLFINPGKDNTEIIFQFWIIKISTQDVAQSLLLVARFIIFLLAISLTTANFSISRFIHGLEDVLLPLTWLKIPIQDLIVSVEIAIRYIPLLTLTAERIAKAQASRGATWGTSEGKIQDKIRQVFPLIVPLFLLSFQKADKIAMAMDARGYGLIKKRTRYQSSRVKLGDVVYILVQLFFIAGSIITIIRY
jgi:energy-coupling factor transport system permease protein